MREKSALAVWGTGMPKEKSGARNKIRGRGSSNRVQTRKSIIPTTRQKDLKKTNRVGGEQKFLWGKVPRGSMDATYTSGNEGEKKEKKEESGGKKPNGEGVH